MKVFRTWTGAIEVKDAGESIEIVRPAPAPYVTRRWERMRADESIDIVRPGARA